MTKLDELKYEVNNQVLEAIDRVLVSRFGTAAMVKDSDLPNLLPYIEKLTEERLRAVYSHLPEVLDGNGDYTDKMMLAFIGLKV